MPEYIDRAAALAAIETAKEWDNVNEAFAAVEEIPAADVAPVVHGCMDDTGLENSTGVIYLCSACAGTWNPNTTDVGLNRVPKLPNYCPNCGAKMDVAEEPAIWTAQDVKDAKAIMQLTELPWVGRDGSGGVFAYDKEPWWDEDAFYSGTYDILPDAVLPSLKPGDKARLADIVEAGQC